MMSLGLHLRIIGRPGRIGAFRDFLQYVSEKIPASGSPRAEKQIAEAFAKAVPAPALSAE